MNSPEQLRNDLTRTNDDLRAHAKTISEIVLDQRAMKEIIVEMRISIATETEKEKSTDARLDRIEKSISTLQKIGVWILAAFGLAFITAFSTFVINGGLSLVAHP